MDLSSVARLYIQEQPRAIQEHVVQALAVAEEHATATRALQEDRNYNTQARKRSLGTAIAHPPPTQWCRI